ncbi:MAG: hypothetical protein GU357_03875 [Thermofilum sp.]|jgi:hypothetical protein|nr:hypothetical protein [Thermofilum sp.]
MKKLDFELGLKCPYMTKDGYCTELKKPCPWPNDGFIVHIIERIRNCPCADLFSTS